MTHNHPMGFLPAIAMGLFISYSIRQDVPIPQWGSKMLKIAIPIVIYNVKKTIRCLTDYIPYFEYFQTKWEMFLETRMILNQESESDWKNTVPFFDEKWEDVEKRDEIYASWGCGGRTAQDACSALIIAYDAILWAETNGKKDRWNKVLDRSVLHGGDCFNSGALAGAFYTNIGKFSVNFSNSMSDAK